MEDVVLLDVDHDVKITGCAAADAGLAVSRRTQSSALPDSRGNLEFASARLFNTSFAAAFLAWLFDDFTGAVATWTCLRDMKKPTRTDHLSAPTTRGTTCFARAWFGAAAMARVARVKLLNLNCLLCAESRLLQLDFHVVPQIRSTMPIVGARSGVARKKCRKFRRRNRRRRTLRGRFRMDHENRRHRNLRCPARTRRARSDRTPRVCLDPLARHTLRPVL